MKTQLILASICALLSVGAFAAQESVACADWSYSNPSCPAYLGSQAPQASRAATVPGTQPALACADWSFSDANCPAYLGNSTPRSAVPSSSQMALSCSDWSFADPSCPAYIGN